MPREKLKFSHWRAVWRFLWNPKTDWKPKVALVAAIIYLLSPIDIIPDFIPVFGWLDDIGILSFVAWYVIHASSQEMG